MRDLIFGVKKEFLEAVRTKKAMTLWITGLFFALLDPVMLKMTPYLLKEFSGVDLSNTIQLTQIAELKDFHQDIYQLFTIVLAIVMGNVWLKEIDDRALVIPVSKGLKPSTIILSKIVAYVVIVNTLIYTAYSVNYFYSGVIFGFDVDYYQVFSIAVMMGLFYIFFIVFIISLSTLVHSFPGVVFITLSLAFGGPFVSTIFKVDAYTPFGLINEASSSFNIVSQTVVGSSSVSVLVESAIIYLIGINTANKREIIEYR